MCARTHKDHIVPLVVFVLAACERCAQRAHCVRAPCALALCLPYCPRSIQLCLCVRAHTKATSCPWSCSCSQLASAGHADLRVVWLRMNSTVPAEAAERSSACVSCMAGKFSESVAAENGANPQDCNAGTYSTVPGAMGADTCETCLPGAYSDAASISLPRSTSFAEALVRWLLLELDRFC